MPKAQFLSGTVVPAPGFEPVSAVSTPGYLMVLAVVRGLQGFSWQNRPDPVIAVQGVMAEAYSLFAQSNSLRAKGCKIKAPSCVTGFMAARMVMQLYRVALIRDSHDPDSSFLAVYESGGKDEGLYLRGNDELLRRAGEYKKDWTRRDKDEFILEMRIHAPLRELTDDPHLCPVGNGVYDTREHVLRPFSPEYVFLTKSDVPYDPSAENPLIHNAQDGTDWDVETWMDGLMKTDGERKLLRQVIAGLVRPAAASGRVVIFLSQAGCNGKGTFCALLRRLCGKDRTVSIPIADFAGRFALGRLPGAMAVITDENDVGVYIEKAGAFKAVVTGDAVRAESKYEQPVTIHWKGLIVECVNEIPHAKDRTNSFYRRMIALPFSKSFEKEDRRYIKDDYLARPQVLRYVMRKALEADFTGFDVPPECRALVDEIRTENDPCRQFVQEFAGQLAWDFVPSKFLYDLYTAWTRQTNPGGKLMSMRSFVEGIAQPMAEEGWARNDEQVHHAKQMQGPEHLIDEYGLAGWRSAHHAGSADADLRSLPDAAVLSRKYRGFERK